MGRDGRSQEAETHRASFGEAGSPAPACPAGDRPARTGGSGRPPKKRKGAGGRGGGSRRAGRRRRSIPVRLVRGLFRWCLIFCVWGAIAAGGLVAYYAAELKSASEWRVPDRPPNIQILAVDGRLIGNRGDTGGEAVTSSDLPAYVPNAVIAIEDRRFRSHFGVDPIGLLRAVAKNALHGGVVEGGSTLTQQLAKNMFLTPERSLKRKVQEVILALWLETKYSKDQILEMYLNRVYFGSGAYGIDCRGASLFQHRPAQPDAGAGGGACRRAAGAEPLCAEQAIPRRHRARLDRPRRHGRGRLHHPGAG